MNHINNHPGPIGPPKHPASDRKLALTWAQGEGLVKFNRLTNAATLAWLVHRDEPRKPWAKVVAE